MELRRKAMAPVLHALTHPSFSYSTVLSRQHKWTLVAEAIAARLKHAQPDGATAGAAELRGVVEKMGEFLGAAHMDTFKWQGVLDEMEK